MGMRKTVLLLVLVGAALLLASGVALVMPKEQAQAAFPGINGKIVFVSSRSGNSDIYTISFNGNNLKRLTTNPTQDFGPAWSADGKKIVYSGGYRGALGALSADIFVMGAN